MISSIDLYACGCVGKSKAGVRRKMICGNMFGNIENVFFVFGLKGGLCVHFNCKYVCLYVCVCMCVHLFMYAECVKPHGDGRSAQFAVFCSLRSSSPSAPTACWCECAIVLHEFCVFSLSLSLKYFLFTALVRNCYANLQFICVTKICAWFFRMTMRWRVFMSTCGFIAHKWNDDMHR